MDKQEALELLLSDSAIDRLRAARALFHLAGSSDLETIESAIAMESDAWVRSALTRIVKTSEIATLTSSAPPSHVVEDVAQLAHDVKAQTTQELTAMIIHEMQPLLGALRTSCMTMAPAVDADGIQRAVTGIESFLTALQGLHRASGVPVLTDFSLSDTVFEAIRTVQDERRNAGAAVILVDVARNDHRSGIGGSRFSALSAYQPLTERVRSIRLCRRR